MLEIADEIIDSQIVAEQVGFLDKCFDNSFTLQSSLLAVKELVKDEIINYPSIRKNNKSATFNRSILARVKTTTLSQVVNESVVSKYLKDWGLPDEIARKYKHRGITEMFDWQVACLANSKVLMDCCNLVYSAPTSAGKTLVAEILTIKTILERQKKVIVILPFVSIVREKMFYLQDILSSSGVRVEGFMGSQSPPGGLQAVHVAICTIEKANSLVNRLLDDGNISELGAVIVDELHLLGDPHRGYILELLLTKIKYVSKKSEDVHIQIVGMSATLPNLEVLANWLNAELFVTQFRPIPLDEYCLVGDTFYDKHGECANTLKNMECTSIEGDSVLNICLDTIKDGCSILIFCMTKNRCENLAKSLSSSFYKLGCQQCEAGAILRSQLKTDSILEVLEQLKNCPVGLDQVLRESISFGVAYHHAGLTFDERDIIEGGFKSGAIRVLVATSTLSSGVNLPARKVIIRSPVFQRQPINILTYKQMIGRAGRMGRDTKGESILICTETEKRIGFELMMGALDPVNSCIESGDKYMRAVLEMIASQVLCTKKDLDLYSQCTLLFNQKLVSQSQNNLLEDTLEELKNYELIRLQKDETEFHYVATPLGKACLSASMAPNDGLSLFLELQTARQCLVLETDLHLIYLVTPYSVSSQWRDVDWLHLLSLWESLTKAMKRVGELVGVQESFIIRCLRGTNKLNNIQNKLNIHKRFYTALALQDLVNEVPLSEVATKFQCARGFLQSLQQSAATFAGMVTAFCHQLGWKNMEILISQFQDRLHFGIHSELLELMKLSTLNGIRARALFDSGYETISSIASADSNVIENILHKAVPFQSEKEREGDDSDDLKKRNKIKSIWITGCCGMTAKEAAENLIVEARKYLQNEIGVTDIKWDADLEKVDKTKFKSDTHVFFKLDNNDLSIPSSATNLIAKSNKCDNVTGSAFDSSSADPNMSDNICESQKHQILPVKMEEGIQVNHIKREIISDQTEQTKHLSGKQNFVSPQKESYSTLESIALSIKTDNDCVWNSININETAIENVTQHKNGNVAKTKEESTIDPVVSNRESLPDQKHSTPILQAFDTKTDKYDVAWDTLNFTEGVIENITKMQKADMNLSPNISFGDTDNSTASIKIRENTLSKLISVKDISLFSTDDNNSSFFDESLPLDLIPSKLLENKKSPLKDVRTETTLDFVNIDSNSILNAFKSPLTETDEEDIKLIYDSGNDSKVDVKTECLNMSKENEVVCSQENIEAINDFKSPYKRKLDKESLYCKAKKQKLDELVAIRRNNFYITKLNLINTVKTKLVINSYSLNCIFLKGNDIYQSLRALENMQAAAIYLNVNHKSSHTNEIIGSKIINMPKTNEVPQDTDSGLAIYLGHETCIYLDLSSLEQKLTLEKIMLKKWFESENLLRKIFSLKYCYLYLKKWLEINLPQSCLDVSLTEWLIDSHEKTPNVEYLMNKYTGLVLQSAAMKVDDKRINLKNLNSKIDACIKAWCVWLIAQKQEECLRNRKHEVLRSVIDTENRVSTILANCEYHGITVDRELASKMLIDVQNARDTVQKIMNKLAGCVVLPHSSKSVAKVLGMYKGSKVSTKKSVLTCHNSPLSSVIIYWRKLDCILTKTLYPLTKKAFNGDENRIMPTYTMHTCTGRISMHEPNLQNVPRTFSVPSTYLPNDTSGIVEFNCRDIFRASPGHVMVSADYCQLEMRVLTHFSEDPVLVRIMRSDVDVFRSMAASWSDLPEDAVDDDLRQKTKQLCYGILYGMGNKTLSHHLDVSELEAAFFMDSFYKTFPDVKKYTLRVIEECRNKGYVETLMKRRRYLPDIKHKSMAARGAAERQAVNTTIQGSAADIAKAAMCAIDNTPSTYKPRLLLQMHDELIYEVRENQQATFVQTIKAVMEGTIRLKVPLPVKVKSGRTWGTLKEINV